MPQILKSFALLFFAGASLLLFAFFKSDEKPITDQHSLASCEKNSVAILEQVGHLKTYTSLKTFPNCIKLLWEDQRLSKYRSDVDNLKTTFVKNRKKHTPQHANETAGLLLAVYPDDSQLKSIVKESEKKLKSLAANEKKKPEVIKKRMDFDTCSDFAYKQARSLGVPFDVIVSTNLMLFIKIPTSDGSLTITCSRPDQQLTYTAHTY